jgi:hypothetical protein
MFFGIIFLRILFIASMVFIFGYIFGNFANNATLKVITKIAAVVLLVSFIATNVVLFRSAHGWRCGNYNHSEKFERYHHGDSTNVRY